MKYKIVLALIVSVAIAVSVNSEISFAQTTPYTWEYNATNLYSDDILVYEFTNLDASQSYSWTIYTADMSTGLPKDKIGFKVIGPGVISGSWIFGAGPIDFGKWPEQYIGPVVVIDGFGFTLGRHFIHPPIRVNGDPTVTQEWESSLGDFAVQTKQVIGNTQVAPNPCQSVVFNTINSSGLHHNFTACQSTTKLGDIAILHFQFNPVGYSSPSNDNITVIALDEGTGSTLAMLLDLDKIASYQVTSGYTGGPTFTAFDSFIVINTGESELPYVNYELADTALTVSSLSNPMRFGSKFGILINDIRGAYGCYRVDNALSVVSDCESTWIVSNDTSPESGNAEWDLRLLNPVSEAGTQVIEMRQETSQVWDAYSGTMGLQEFYSGFNDINVYTYETSRTSKYVVNNTAASAIDVTWQMSPRFVPFLSNSVAPADYLMITATTYNIELVTSIEESVETVIRNLGLDTELGRTLLLGVMLMLSIVFVAFIPVARESLLSYLISWTAVGGVFVVAGFASQFGGFFFLLITIFMWLMAFTIFKGSLSRNSVENA